MGRQRLPVGSDETEQKQSETKTGQPVEAVPTKDTESPISQPVEDASVIPVPTEAEQARLPLSPERIDLVFELQRNNEELPSHWFVLASCGWFTILGMPWRRRRPNREHAAAGRGHR